MPATIDLEPALAAVLPEGFPWRLEASARLKHARLEVRDGHLIVRVPLSGITADRLAKFVAQHGPRLLARAAAAPAVTKELVNGEGFDLFGRPYRLMLVDDGPACDIRRQPVGQHRPGDEQGSMGSLPFLCLRRDVATVATVTDWYRRQLAEYLDEQLPTLAVRLGVAPGLTWKVRTPRVGRPGSWASYKTPPRHEITVSWQVAQFPRDLVDHVLRHEMVHAAAVHRRPGASGRPHGREFQAKMSALHPQWRNFENRVRNQIDASIWDGRLAPANPGHVSGWGASTA